MFVVLRTSQPKTRLSSCRSFHMSTQFEIGLPIDGPYQRRHQLSFSHLEPSSDYSPSSTPGAVSPSSSTYSSSTECDSVSTASSASLNFDSYDSSRWRSPRASFKFSAKDVPFPIDIEAPFESFRTILWGVWMNKTESIGETARDEDLPPKRQQCYKRLITKGLERVSTYLLTCSF